MATRTVPRSLALPNPSLHPTCASLQLSHAGELERYTALHKPLRNTPVNAQAERGATNRSGY